MVYSNFDGQVEDDDEQIAGQPVVKPGSTQTSSGSSGGGPSAAPVAAVGAGSDNNQRKFAGIQDYIKANKSQTSNLANQLGSSVKQAGNEARTAINSGTDQFNKDVDQNTVKVDPNVVNRVKEDPASLVGGVKDLSTLNTKPNNGYDFGANSFTRAPAKIINKPKVNPNLNIQGDTTQINNNLTNLNDLTKLVKMKDAEYTGPTSLLESDYYQPMESQVQEAEQASANARTEEGNRDLLSNLHKQQIGSVNTGALGLDNALLRGDQNARNILSSAADSNNDLNSLLTGAVGTAAGRAAAGQKTTDSTRSNVRNEIGRSSTDFENALNQRVEDAIANSATQTEAIQNVLSTGGTPTPEQLQYLGITPEQWTQITNPDYAGEVNLMDYLTVNDPNINAGNVATEEDYAREQALELLMGESNDLLSDPSQAGQANIDRVDFDVPSVISKIDQIMLDRKTARETYERQEMERIRQAGVGGNYQEMGYREYPGK